ncbi:hypothetical protein [Thalassomonas sp. RHCl1]|uniref:hypothetical protein n=1 Tax=Thalassomonas sp. RHCl1 TaxID=2995320 RepID=UPI00248B1623|nr:hypothetical protein [Thalassomonas sp. RHCl1]
MPSLNQATKVFGESIYRFGGDTIEILGAPEDTDWLRWGMLNDRKLTRLYFFKNNSENQIYQFIFLNGAFRYDNTLPVISITGVTKTMNTGSIAMLSTPNFEEVQGVNGKDLPVPNNYHVYMQDRDDATQINQFIWEKGTENLEHNGITRAKFAINGFPEDTDWSRWTMTYDSNRYQLSLPAYVYYAFKQGSNTELYHGRYGHKDAQGTDVYGYEGVLTLEGAPENTDHSGMAMVFDGIDTHLYMLTK